MKARSYKGHNIYECERIKGEHAGNWIVQTYHSPTGMPWSDEECPHFPTLKAARDYINMIKEEATA